MTKDILIRYGVTRIQKGWAVTTDVEIKECLDGKKRLYSHVCYELVYKRLDFALKKADQFARKCHTGFESFNGNIIGFTFENLGVLPEGGTIAE